ncbi:hypothetical protein MMC11_002534 [Xylographa trunciseda]|nr:hypothetical protein [Xylographa trunciseda]
MAPHRRHGVPVSSPRYLVLRHARILLQARARAAAGEAPHPKLEAGHEQLFSSHVPGLRAGKHTIEVTQSVKVTDKSDSKSPGVTKQDFDVLTPRFVLPPNCIYSTYPASGSSAPVETLAHVVLNDTTLPWERDVDTGPARLQRMANDDGDDDKARNRIPWLACLTFEANELLLTEQQLKGIGEQKSIFAGTSKFTAGIKQSSTLSVKLDISDFILLDQAQVVTPYKTIDGESQPEGELIFVKPSLFDHLFTNMDENGLPARGQTYCSLSRYQYLAHVRHINTQGMADAGADDEATDRLFSIIPSHRTGPPGRPRPSSLVSHLVSIEGIEKLLSPVDKSKLVALPSLHSWAHTCLPAGSFNLANTFQNLGKTEGMLRAPSEIIPKIAAQASPAVAAEISKRLEDGFSMLRWRTVKGDTTAALTRSPFIPKSPFNPKATDLSPQQPPPPPRETLSNSGQFLQILDQKLGVMDLSYSAAWQLGRTLALADQSFTAALCRVRKEILQQATDKARRAILYATGSSVMEKRHLVCRLGDLVSHLAELPITIDSASLPIDLSQRWRRAPRPMIEVTYHHASVVDILDSELRHAAFRIGSSVDPCNPRVRADDDPHYDPPYDEHNTPASADWMVVLKFVLDLLHLVNVPMHYIVTDASHLPPESLRFFHIDLNWTAALVDGALCLGNHVDRDKDRVRKAMKEAIDRYREHVSPDLGYKPPIPTYGFLLRSAVVKEFPDLVVSTQPVVNPEHVPLIARQEILDADLMLVLLTEAPGMTKLEYLTFAQPAHQQCFTAAESLTRDDILLSYKRMYTTTKPDDPNMKYPIKQDSWARKGKDPKDRPRPYVWGTTDELDDLRILNVEHLAKHVYDTLQATLNDKELKIIRFGEIGPTAAMLGIQLNDPCWQLNIKWPEAKPKDPASALNYLPRTAVAPLHQKAIPAHGAHHFSFAERRSLPLLYLGAPPPHFGSIRPAGPLSSQQLKGPRMHPTSSSPVYLYNVYSAADPDLEGVQTLGEAQDLIFSIVYKSNALDFQLRELAIEIPVGNVAQKCLTDEYRGSGTFMLSNLRMNVLPTYSSDEKVLRIVMVPRSHFGYVKVKYLAEMSFMLSGVQVSRDYEDGTKVPCSVSLAYWDQPDKTTFDIPLLKPKDRGKMRKTL